ncbi:MAG: hypothetical protein HAW63_02985 [Bdellovibrionaceae bacterium]|nr:hypothetical protein [Pseudobdellovibrionaceae bacterium]
MRRNHYFAKLSLLLMITAITSCGEKTRWSISEPVLILQPKKNQAHISAIKKNSVKTSVNTKLPYAFYFSQFKHFVNLSEGPSNHLDLQLNSQLHFQEKDLGLELKVISICAPVKKLSEPLTYITHITKIKIKNILSFINFIPKKALQITSSPLLPDFLKCDFKFTAYSSDKDQHQFKLSRKIKTTLDTNVLQGNLHLALFYSEYKEKMKEIELKSSTNPLSIKEQELSGIYIKPPSSPNNLKLECQNSKLNSVIKISDWKKKKKHLFLSEFNSTENIRRVDIPKKTFCRVLEYDQFYNIIKLSRLFSIELNNITYTPKQKRESNYGPCDVNSPRYRPESCHL